MIRNKKKYNIIIFAIILIGMIAFIPSLSSNIINVNNDSKNDDNLIDNEIKTKTPTLSKYISTYNDSGGAFNVTLHQSLVNTTKVRIINTSKTDNITFYEKCPTDTNFNSTFTNITIEDIYAPNKTLIVEELPEIDVNLGTIPYLTSFKIPTYCNLKNFSIYVNESSEFGSGSLFLYLYNSSWSGFRPEPEDQLKSLVSGEIVDNFEGWYNFTSLNEFLDISNTENNTFFISCIDGNVNTKWFYEDEDNGDDTYAYFKAPPVHQYESGKDFTLKVGLKPLNNTPNPEHIGLKINNSPAKGYLNVNGSGYWNSTEEYSNSTGSLKFNVSAEWWDVACNITKVQINYTKSNILANSFFNTSGNGDDIFWNVTIDDPIDDFKTDFGNYSINFTISSNWTSIQVFNGSKKISSTEWDRGDGWQIVQVSNATNGTFWGLNTSSPNFISSIGMFVEGDPKNTVNSSDIVRFNATFLEKINATISEVNLTVYGPSQDFMNYTYINNTSPLTKFINLSDWDVSDNVTAYGKFRVRVFWNNGTTVGFYRENLTIIGNTHLSITYPEQDIDWFSDEYFNITIFYNDTNNEVGVSGAEIEYNFGAGFQSTNLFDYGNGYYNITIYNWKVRDYGFGLKNIQINANKTFYVNQTKSYSYYLYNVTTKSIDQDTLGVIRGINATFTVHYMWNDSTPISGADLELISIDPNFISSWKDNGDGRYDLILNTSNVIGKGSNSYEIMFNISSLYNETQVYTVNLFVYNRTDLIITYPDQNIDWLSDEYFNITIFYNDTDNEIGIAGADIEYNFSAGFQSTNLFDYGNGYYNITIYNWQVRDYGFGLKNIQINANKTYFENQTKSYSYYLYNATIQSIDQDTLGVIRSTNATFTAYYKWNDSTPISGADLELISIDPSFISSWKDNGDGSYNLTLNTSNVIGKGSNSYEITFNISSIYNETQVYTVNLFVYNRTDLIITYPEQNIDWYSDDIFNITIFYNDTDNEAGISGAEIEYDFGAGFQSTNFFDYGNGYYNITIYNWQVRNHGYGLKNIQIYANKTYFENQTNTYNYYLYNATIQSIDQDTLGVIRSTNATFTVHYMWNDSTPISGADLELISIDPNFITSWKDNGDGSYDLILNTSNIIGKGSNSYEIIFNISSLYNETQIYTINLFVCNRTELIITYPDQNIDWYSEDYFNITIFYNDTDNEAGISGADIKYNFGAGNQSTNLFDYGNGYYNITIYNWQVRQYGYGLTNIQIYANKIYFENQTNTYSYYLYNVTIQSIDQDTLAVIRGFNATFTVHYMWNDSTPISGADLELISIDTNFITSWKDNGDGSYDLILNTSNVIGKGSNSYEITFNISSLYNETQIYTINLFVCNRTELIITYPDQNIDWYSEDYFNITIFYNDTDNKAGISGADIKYNFGAGNQSTNLFDYGNGYYNITIYNWQVRNHGYGLRNIQIYANKIYFENQTNTYNYYLYNATIQSIDQDTLGVIRSTNATFTVHYMWNDSTPISGADLELISIDPNFITSWKDNGDGSYDLILNTSNVIGKGSNSYEIIFNISSLYNETQIYTINLFVYNRTDLIITYPEQNIDWLSEDYFNITIFYNDTDNEIGVSGAEIEYDFGAGFQSTNLFDYGNGYYNITIYNWKVRDYGFGLKNIQIKANKTYFENQTNSYSYYLYNATTQFIDQNTLGVIRGINATFTVNYMWNDSTPISGADLELISIDPNFISSWKDNGDGSYNLTLNTSNVIGKGSNSYEITFNISSIYNETQVYTVNLFVYNRTDLIITYPEQNIDWYSDDIFNITIFYNDTDNEAGIDGAVIYYTITGQPESTLVLTNGTAGYYFITIDCSIFDSTNYGDIIVDISANKTFYVNSTTNYYFTIICLTDLNLFEPNQNDTFLEDQKFNITIYFNDINTDNPIDGANVSYFIDGKGWQWTNLNNGTGGYYNITIDVSDLYFLFGYNRIIIYANQTYYRNQTLDFWFHKVIRTNVIVFPEIVSVIRGKDASFQLNYSDRANKPITNTTGKVIISVVSIHPSFTWTISEDGNGNYTIVLHTMYVNVGTHICTFNISAIGNETQIIILTVHVYMIQTEILIVEGDYNSTLVRWQGFDQSIIFYFNDTDNNLPITDVTTLDVIVYNGSNPTQKWQGGTGDNWTLIALPALGDGYYRLNVSIIGLNSGSYSMMLNISKFPNYNFDLATIDFYIRGNYSAIGSLEVANPGGAITPSDGDYTTFIGSDITIEFTFTDSENGGILIEDLLGDPTDDAAYFIIYHKGIEYGTISHSLHYDRNTNTHKGSLDISGLALGEYILTFHVSRINYENSTLVITIIIGSKYDINATLINPSNIISANGTYNIEIKIEYTPGGTIWNLLSNVNVYNVPIFNGIGQPQIQNATNLQGFVEFTITAQVGIQNLTFRLTILATYYTVEKSIQFSIILSKYDINATLIDPPNAVTAGEPFKIRAKIEYLDENSVWQLFSDAVVTCIPIIDGIEQAGSQNSTNSLGIVEFTITVPLEAQNVTLKFIIQTSYNTNEKPIEFASIIVNPPAVIEIILIILIIAAIVTVGAISYKGIIVPKKRRKREAIMEVATAFDDAINLEHLLVLSKVAGTCIFFRSYGAEKIDPDLIGGFLTAVQSFGKEIKYQQSLNEITYGDKMLLLGDGEYIRVALVLGKKGSLILRRNITRFIKMFEGRFGHILQEWKADLRPFHESDDLVDQAFNTSIILPHEINVDALKLKEIKSSLAKKLLKLAQNIIAEKERKYFFIASLLNEATDKIGEDTSELFVALKELRENKAIIPIKIEKIIPIEISQQELSIISQRVNKIEGLSSEEREILVQEMSHMSSAAREALLTSMAQRGSIVSAPVKTEEGAMEVSDEKSAKMEIKNLERKAAKLKKENDLKKAVELYENASILAETWNLSVDSGKLKEKARLINIKYLEIEMNKLVEDAEKAVKTKVYIEAFEKYLEASRKASAIFKLGVSGIDKQVREYENKAREYEKYT